MKKKAIRPEIKLLLCCTRTKIDSKVTEEIRTILNQDLDWNYILEIASYNQVLSLLYFNLNKNFSELIPQQVLVKLKHFFGNNAKRNLFLARELIFLLKLFEDNNIQAFPFKGAVLADYAYGNLALRQFSDLDILVNKKDFLKAKKLLVNKQYKLQLTKLEEIFVSEHAFQSPFLNPKGIVSLDLHWGLAPKRPRRYSRFNCLWNNPKSISLAGQSVQTFSPESMLVIQCINAVKEPQKLLLKKICDVAEIIQAYPHLDWEKFFVQAQQLGCERLVLTGLDLTHRLYEMPLPDEVLSKISSISIVRKLSEELKQLFFQQANHPEKVLAEDFMINKYIFQTIEPQDKFLYLFDKMITPHSKDRAFISLPSSLYLLYYLVRPIRLARETFNNFYANRLSIKKI